MQFFFMSSMKKTEIKQLQLTLFVDMQPLDCDSRWQHQTKRAESQRSTLERCNSRSFKKLQIKSGGLKVFNLHHKKCNSSTFYSGSRSRQQQQQECGNASRSSAAAPPPSLVPDLLGWLSGRWLTTPINAQVCQPISRVWINSGCGRMKTLQPLERRQI